MHIYYIPYTIYILYSIWLHDTRPAVYLLCINNSYSCTYTGGLLFYRTHTHTTESDDNRSYIDVSMYSGDNSPTLIYNTSHCCAWSTVAPTGRLGHENCNFVFFFRSSIAITDRAYLTQSSVMHIIYEFTQCLTVIISTLMWAYTDN